MPRPKSTYRPTCIDLFSGAGGIAVGFRNAGWSILGANDFNPDAEKTFRLNFPEAHFFSGEIAGVEASDVLNTCGIRQGELDAILGGPPCQSFSYNNHQRSATNERARLFDHYLRLVEGLRPKCLIMENVPGILTIDGGSVIDEICSRLNDMGYTPEVRVLSAEKFGTPQVRRRVFIVASRIGDPEELLPTPTHQSHKDIGQPRLGLKPPVNIKYAIGDLPEIENGGGEVVSSYQGHPASSTYQKKMRANSRKLHNHVCHRLTEVNLRRIRNVPEGGNWRDIPFHMLTAGMQRAKPTDHTKRYGRLAWTGLASTLLTKCDPHWGAYVHPAQDRTISVREAARLQGFPDCFVFAGDKLGPHYEQIGNAVPVPVAEALAEAAKRHVENVSNSKYSIAAE